MDVRFQRVALGLSFCLAVTGSTTDLLAGSATGTVSASVVRAEDVDERAEAEVLRIRLPGLYLEFDAAIDSGTAGPAILSEAIGKFCDGATAPPHSQGRLSSDPANLRVLAYIMVERGERCSVTLMYN